MMKNEYFILIHKKYIMHNTTCAMIFVLFNFDKSRSCKYDENGLFFGTTEK